MSGRGRLSLCAAVATLAAACSLLPLVDPATWLLQAGLLVGVQSVAGALVRRVPLARPLTVLVQAVVSLLLLTAAFVREEAVAGLLPGPQALASLGELLTTGTQDVGRYAIPAPVSDGIRLLLVGGVLVIALLVDMLAVTYRSAAPAGLPLLALYSVAAGLSPDGTRWLWFLCASGGYLLLLLAEGRERLSQWGRVFGDRSRPGAAPHQPGSVGGTASAPVRTGRRIGALSLGIALVVPALMPSLGGGLLDSVRGTGTGPGGSDTVSAVNPLVALQDSLNQPENRTVLTYSTDSPSPGEMYLRIVALDEFDGAAWKPSERSIVDVPSPLPRPRGLAPDVRTEWVTTDVTAAEWYAQNWLPMPYPASEVRVDGRWRFEPEGRTVVGDRGQTTRGQDYAVESLLVRPTSRQLRAAGTPPGGLREEYTRVPDSLPRLVGEEARRITGGSANDYERALALQQYFAQDGGFTYDTQVKAGSGSAAIVNFLEQKEGFCVHFAFSMAAMARTLGIPARVAVGFTPGTEGADGRMVVGLQDAHAWPELYFEGAGWTRFEPTPTRGSAPAYAQPDVPDVEEGGEDELPARPDASGVPSPEPSTPQECTAQEKRLDPQCGAPPVQAGGGSGGGALPVLPSVIAGGVLLALLLLALPMLWRVRVRARRLGGNAGVLDAWRELMDSGWDLGIPPDGSSTPRRTAERLAEDGGLDTAATAAVRRIALSVEQVLYARQARPAPGLAQDVRTVRDALRAAAPRGARLRAVVLPRSAVRVIWAASELRTAAAGRVRALLRRPRVAAPDPDRAPG
jgi:transglutaminase-like putative cysteine protease